MTARQSGAGGDYTITGIAPGGYLVEFSTAGRRLPALAITSNSSSRATAQKLTLTGEQERTGVDAALPRSRARA